MDENEKTLKFNIWAQIIQATAGTIPPPIAAEQAAAVYATLFRESVTLH